MVTIYGVHRSRAIRALWAMHELDRPYELVPVIQRYRLSDAEAAELGIVHTKSPSFLAVNPNGHIPSMRDGDVTIHESYAMTLYLAEKFGGPLAPASLAERGAMLHWSFWAATEIETTCLDVLVGTFGTKVAKPDPAKAAEAAAKLVGPFAVLDAALAATGHLVGGRFTVADLNVAEAVRYARSATALFEGAPHVARWLDACHARPAFRTVWAAREAEPA